MRIITTIVAGLLCAGAVARAAATLTFGGKAIAIDMTSCSPDNSNDGKSRAIAAMDMASASGATIQFASLDPPSGDYRTVAGEDDLGAGKVVFGMAGSAFGGGSIATPGQGIAITRTASGYRAVFSGIAVVDMESKAPSPKTLAGDLSCSN
jgi:hypothetical protein